MAGCRRLVAPVRGLLLCVVALHLCLQDPLASAEQNAAATTTKKATAATTTTSVASTTKNTVGATTTTSVAATTKNAVGATTTKNAVATTTLMATTTSVATTTKNAVVATSITSLAATTKNAAVTTTLVAAVTKNATAAATSTSMATTKNAAAAATKNTAAANTTLVAAAATSNASVATNTSVNITEETRLTCQSFQCSGERCYQDKAHANATVTCRNETYCELYRFSRTNYTAGCSGACGAEMCRTNSSGSRQRCVLDCCRSSLCLRLDASSYGDLPPATAPPATTTTTPRPPPRNGKVCAAFSCHGEGCFKGRTTAARCIVGQDFCEMKKSGLSYVAGCSRACKAAKPVCAGGVKAACYQECCPASPTASCLKLDGKVHVSGAGRVAPAPLLQLLLWAVVLLLAPGVSPSLGG